MFNRGPIEGTVVVEAAHEAEALVRQFEQVLSQPGVERMEVLVLCLDHEREATEAALSRFPTLRIPADVLHEVRTDKLAFLPFGSSFPTSLFAALDDDHCVSILPPAANVETRPKLNGWVASRALLQQLPPMRSPTDWDLITLEALLRKHKCTVTWPSLQNPSPDIGAVPTTNHAPALTTNASVLAMIPHFGCEEWLECCLNSIVAQTRPLDGIVVIDDASKVPPTDIVEKFPNVTLLTAAESVGPYRLKQQVINSTSYDAYLLQDADDWSSNSRLELLLAEAQRTGADIVGSQEIRWYWDREQVVPITYPADVNATLEQNIVCDPLLHPACLISRDIMRRLNGFATGLRFAGDTEFLLRARYAARMVNVPFYCYFKRRRAGSLTMSPETGIRSPARTEIVQKLAVRGTANAEAKASGKLPDLMPSPVAGPVELIHVTGPELRSHE